MPSIEGDKSTSSISVPEQESISAYPSPIPEDWKEGRKKNAEEWFQSSQSELLLESTRKAKQAEEDAEKVAAQLLIKKASDKKLADYQAFKQKINLETRSFLAELKSEYLIRRNERKQILHFPHYTRVKPLLLLYDTAAKLPEAVFVRALYSSLLTSSSCVPLPPLAPAAAAGKVHVRKHRQSGNGPGTEQGINMAASPEEAVWCDLQDARQSGEPSSPSLERLEALERCRAVLVIMSPTYARSEQWAQERRVIINRMHNPECFVAGPLQVMVVRLRYGEHKDVELDPDLHLTGVPEGVNVNPFPEPIVVDIPNESNGTKMRVMAGLVGLMYGLPHAGLQLHETVTICFHPSYVRAGGPIWTYDPISRTFVRSAAPDVKSPAQRAGQQALDMLLTVALHLPPPYNIKSLADWSIYDTQVWLKSLGSNISFWSQLFLDHALDGWALSRAEQADLAGELCGVTQASAAARMWEEMQRHQGQCVAAALQESAAEALPASLLSASQSELAQVFLHVVQFYDMDGDGHLSLPELAQLLQACNLGSVQAKDVLDEYDVDNDLHLDLAEANLLLWDIWALTLARLDSAAWAADFPVGDQQSGRFLTLDELSNTSTLQISSQPNTGTLNFFSTGMTPPDAFQSSLKSFPPLTSGFTPPDMTSAFKQTSLEGFGNSSPPNRSRGGGAGVSAMRSSPMRYSSSGLKSLEPSTTSMGAWDPASFEPLVLRSALALLPASIPHYIGASLKSAFMAADIRHDGVLAWRVLRPELAAVTMLAGRVCGGSMSPAVAAAVAPLCPLELHLLSRITEGSLKPCTQPTIDNRRLAESSRPFATKASLPPSQHTSRTPQSTTAHQHRSSHSKRSSTADVDLSVTQTTHVSRSNSPTNSPPGSRIGTPLTKSQIVNYDDSHYKLVQAFSGVRIFGDEVEERVVARASFGPVALDLVERYREDLTKGLYGESKLAAMIRRMIVQVLPTGMDPLCFDQPVDMDMAFKILRTSIDTLLRSSRPIAISELCMLILIKEAGASLDGVTGGCSVASWSATLAHMLHVYRLLVMLK